MCSLYQSKLWPLEYEWVNFLSYDLGQCGPSQLKTWKPLFRPSSCDQPMSLLIWTTAFSCILMLAWCGANKIQMWSTAEENAKSCWSVTCGEEADLCNNRTPPPPTRGSRKTQQQVCCFYCMFLKCKQEEAHYQSTTGTISSSGWFPTTWSMKSSFPFGLEERMKKKTNTMPTGRMTLLYD